jgi:hypothetical protein
MLFSTFAQVAERHTQREKLPFQGSFFASRHFEKECMSAHFTLLTQADVRKNDGLRLGQRAKYFPAFVRLNCFLQLREYFKSRGI